MKNIKIVFYKSADGELVKVKEFFREVEELQELISNPPEEFFDMLGSHFPVHGWAEMEDDSSTVFVVFASRGEPLHGIGQREFKSWLENVTPSDLKNMN